VARNSTARHDSDNLVFNIWQATGHLELPIEHACPVIGFRESHSDLFVRVWNKTKDTKLSKDIIGDTGLKALPGQGPSRCAGAENGVRHQGKGLAYIRNKD
jgi:hypothetical protein